MNEFREVKATLSVTETGEITGMAWPWDIPDRVGDIMSKGALTVPTKLPMLWSHDTSEVIGVWEDIKDTGSGIEVKGRLLIDEVAKAREVHALVKSQAVNGLSIGFETTTAKPIKNRRGRRITKANLLEVSIVAVPCHPNAQIHTIKSDGISNSEGIFMENEAVSEIEAATPANDAPQVDLKALNAVQKRLDKLEAKSTRPQGVHVSSPNVVNTDETKSFATFLRSGDATEVKSLAYGSGTGGILAPETVSQSILEKVAEFSPMRGLAQSIQMNGPLLQLPRLIDEVNPVDVAEGGEITEDEPTFDQIDVRPHEMGIITPATKTLLEDAHIDLSSYLSNHIARRFGQKEAAWFINGNGTTQAEGVMQSADVQSKEVEALTADVLIDQFYSVKTQYSANGTWLMNRATMAEVRKLKDTDGTYLWQEALASGQPATLLGRPVREAVDMANPTAGKSPIIFGDFAKGYAIADRIGFEIVRDELTGAANGIVKFIARRRVGGRVVMGEALSKLSLAA